MLFVSAFLLGLVFNAAPGAVFAETVRRGLRGGYRPALAVQFGSLVGDATWAVLGLAGVGALLQVDALRWPIGLAGALYLLYLARDAWRLSRTEVPAALPGHGYPDRAAAAAGQSVAALKSGILLSLTNTHNLAFWAALGSAMGAIGVREPDCRDFALFFAGFMTSSVLWCFLCAWVVATVFRRADAAWARWTYRLCAAAFVVLAIVMLRDLMAPDATPSVERVAASSHPARTSVPGAAMIAVPGVP